MPTLIAIMGPTAVGKTAVAEGLADELGAVLLNADAFQIYRGMDIGTAKPERRERYSLLDLKDPDESFGVGEWVLLARDEIVRAHADGRSVVVVGGTGLYIRALFESYSQMAGVADPAVRAELDTRVVTEGLPALAEELEAKAPELAARTDLKNPARVKRALERLILGSPRLEFDLPPMPRLKFAIDLPQEVLAERIATRITRMVQNGWVAEIKGLRDAGYKPEHPGFRAIGYRSMWKVLAGEIERDEAIATTIAETRRYAKRQRTWLRSEPRLAMIELESSLADPQGAALEQIRSAIEVQRNG